MGLVSFLLRRLLAAHSDRGRPLVATFVIMRVLPGDPAGFFASSPVPTARDRLCRQSLAWTAPFRSSY